MANPNVLDDSTNKGSGRFRLPARLRASNFAATVAQAISDAPSVNYKTYTTAQRNTLATGWGNTQKGRTVYDSTLDCLVVWTGAAWSTPDGGTPA
jgi:hypothetical protein